MNVEPFGSIICCYPALIRVFEFQMAGSQQNFRYLQHVASEKACAQCYYSYFQPFLDRPVDSKYCRGIFHIVSHPPVPPCAGVNRKMSGASRRIAAVAL